MSSSGPDNKHEFAFPNSAEFYRRLVDKLYDAVYFVDRDRRITYWNEAAEKLTGYARSQVLGTLCSANLLNHVDETGAELCTTRCPLSATIADGQPREANVFLRHQCGHRVPVSVRVCAITDDENKIVGAVEIFSDNSNNYDALQKVGELQRAAFIDPLTSLRNRRFLEMKLDEALQSLHKFGVPFGAMMVDIDRFKQVNDRHGHAMGDAVLVATAATLAASVRTSDFVGRWGGEEFLAVLPQISMNSLVGLAERCRALVERTAVPACGKGSVRVTISAGITIARPEDSRESLLARVDSLLYESKRNGRNRITPG